MTDFSIFGKYGFSSGGLDCEEFWKMLISMVKNIKGIGLVN